MKILFWITLLPIAVLAAAFAVNNRGDVSLNLEPFAFTLTLPVYLAVLAPAFVGFLIGGLVSWLSHGKLRRLARERNRRIGSLEREIAKLREEEAGETPAIHPGEPRTREEQPRQARNGAQPLRAANQ